MSETITVTVPLTIRRRGGRKVVLSPAGQAINTTQPRIDNTLVKALARAFRWQRMLESGDYATIGELATAEKIHAGYLRRILRLTLLPPGMVEAILDGEYADLILADFVREPPTDWVADAETPKAF